MSLIAATVQEIDDRIAHKHDQDVIDSLSVLEAVLPMLHEELWHKLVDIFLMLSLALWSKYAIIRQCALRCFATVHEYICIPCENGST